MTTTTPPGLTPADESYHPVAPGRWWNESWYFDFTSHGGTLGGYVRIGLYPDQGRCWYWACLVGEGRPLVTVIDHDVPLPPYGSLEVRHEGLWADHNVETPFDHVTLGCEAFALGVDDPAEVYGAARGDRVPFGLDLEWDTVGDPYAYPSGVTRYEVSCQVHGEVLVGDERIAVDGPGQRDHSWGERDWWTLGWTWTSGALDDGTRFHGTAVRVGDDVLPFHPGYTQAAGGPLAPVAMTGSAAVPGAHGFPVSATFTLDDLVLAVEPVAFAPVLLEDGAGRVSRFPRALCRFTDAATGRRGTGWTEWNQPQPA
ncbi:MAG TPA: hypothetical protein VFI47_26250 [Acidimicrobiales bacterium]|nr:hypothetical protein [Acidimicrobiales bacterium]